MGPLNDWIAETLREMGWPAAGLALVKVWTHTLSKLRQIEPWIYDFSIRVYGMSRAVRCVLDVGLGLVFFSLEVHLDHKKNKF